jgi:heme-degrading monooxygenase HmoA
MANVWTHGVWTVKPGREDEFVEVWRALARQGTAALDVVEPPTLLRDRDRPNEFISFGPWPSLDEVDRFRSSELFTEAQERLRDVVESFVTRTLDEVQHG